MSIGLPVGVRLAIGNSIAITDSCCDKHTIALTRVYVAHSNPSYSVVFKLCLIILFSLTELIVGKHYIDHTV